MVVCAGIAFWAINAVMSLEVSNTCGCCPGFGTLWTRVPAGIRTLSGEPGALVRVKARNVEAATPGEGL